MDPHRRFYITRAICIINKKFVNEKSVISVPSQTGRTSGAAAHRKPWDGIVSSSPQIPGLPLFLQLRLKFLMVLLADGS
jgi:hypothetical protein